MTGTRVHMCVTSSNIRRAKAPVQGPWPSGRAASLVPESERLLAGSTGKPPALLPGPRALSPSGWRRVPGMRPVPCLRCSAPALAPALAPPRVTGRRWLQSRPSPGARPGPPCTWPSQPARSALTRHRRGRAGTGLCQPGGGRVLLSPAAVRARRRPGARRRR